MATTRRHEYDEDFFRDSRMTFGEHLEELRMRMWKAIKGFGLCLVIGFFLDGVGTMMGWKHFGVGKPVMDFIKKPVEDQMQDFYNERVWNAMQQLDPPKTDEERKQRDKDKEKFLDERRGLGTDEVNAEQLNEPQPLRVRVSRAELKAAVEGGQGPDADLTLYMHPLETSIVLSKSSQHIGKRMQLTTLGVMEAFMVYFKVSLMCGFIIACPWVFYQFWAFVGAGLYPHEKRYVHVYLPFSIGLFLVGIAVCQFLVLPNAVKALLSFNEWLGLDPDLRLNEWLGFAIILPLVFGISFQTPLVMLFFNRLGLFSWEDYLSKWRYAVMFLAIFAAIITPTPDAVTMMYLFVPMMGLYLFGILLCRMMPAPARQEEEEYEEEVAV